MNTNTKFLTFGTDGEYRLPVADLSESVVHTLMQRTFAHIMGNEAAAVRARMAAEKDDAGDAKYNDAELASAVHDWRQAKIEAIANGEFSLRVVGPRLTADEKILREFARNAIIAQCNARKVPMPKASDKAAWDAAEDQFLATPKLRALADAELERRKAAVVPTFDMDFDSLKTA